MLKQIKDYLFRENLVNDEDNLLSQEELEEELFGKDELTTKEKLEKGLSLVKSNIESMNEMRNEIDSSIAKLKKAKDDLKEKLRRLD